MWIAQCLSKQKSYTEVHWAMLVFFIWLAAHGGLHKLTNKTGSKSTACDKLFSLNLHLFVYVRIWNLLLASLHMFLLLMTIRWWFQPWDVFYVMCVYVHGTFCLLLFIYFYCWWLKGDDSSHRMLFVLCIVVKGKVAASVYLILNAF